MSKLAIWKEVAKKVEKCEVKDCDGKAEHLVTWKGVRLWVCRYHGAGVVVVKPVRSKIKDVPDALCTKYCPQFFEGECRMFTGAETDAEERKRGGRFRGMYALCMQDEWWR